jgi:hypothetical protein
VKHFLRSLPDPTSSQPGDVLITNDIWLGTGHLPDITLAKPIFRDGSADRVQRHARRTRPTSAARSAAPSRARCSRRACRSRR